MKVEKASKKDVKKIFAMLSKEFPNSIASEKEIEEKMKSNEFEFFKIVEKDKFVGFVEIEYLTNEIARLNAIIIDENKRNEGYGKKLLKSVIQELKKRGVKIISVFVESENIAAKSLYLQVGFKFAGQFEDIETGNIIEEYEYELADERPEYVV